MTVPQSAAAAQPARQQSPAAPALLQSVNLQLRRRLKTRRGRQLPRQQTGRVTPDPRKAAQVEWIQIPATT